MSLEFAILGFLNYHPYTGYDLKKIFDTSIRHFWPADQSQIYRTLARLTETGPGGDGENPPGGPPRPQGLPHHRAGRAELRKWLAGPPPMDEPRSAPLIQVFFAGQLSDEEILAKFEGFAAMMRAILAGYEAVPGRSVPTRRKSPRRASISSGC